MAGSPSRARRPMAWRARCVLALSVGMIATSGAAVTAAVVDTAPGVSVSEESKPSRAELLKMWKSELAAAGEQLPDDHNELSTEAIRDRLQKARIANPNPAAGDLPLVEDRCSGWQQVWYPHCW